MNKKSLPVLAFDAVSFSYEPHIPPVLEHVTFSVARGSFVALVGPSGGGKSTLLRLAIGLDMPLSGRITNSARTRMIFQNAALLPWCSALDNVLIGLSDLPYSKEEKVEKARAALTELGLSLHIESMPRELSGGQRQRVGIARALVSEPEVLLLDEPFSALDIDTAGKLADEVAELSRTRGITMLMVSHSVYDAAYLADEIYICHNHTVTGPVVVPLTHPRKRSDPALALIIASVSSVIGNES